MAEETAFTAEDEKELVEWLAQSGAAPLPEQKYNVHTYLFSVATAKDTTKVGNITKEELGMPSFPVRSYKALALIAKEIMKDDFIANYFAKESEDVTSTSLSKEGFLDKLAVTNTRQVADITKRKSENKGWFKKKEQNDDNDQ